MCYKKYISLALIKVYCIVLCIIYDIATKFLVDQNEVKARLKRYICDLWQCTILIKTLVCVPPYIFTHIHEFIKEINAHHIHLSFPLPSLSGGPYYTTPSATTNALSENDQDRARVLCNYDARDSSELSVMQDEVTKFEI